MATPKLIHRAAQSAVEAALADTRVVVILGARQVGKSTLLEQVASSAPKRFEIVTLDNQAVRRLATADPAGFIAGMEAPVAIDEIQRVPELMTEIKLRVDTDPSPGQFILTGSANLLEMRRVKESLAGRAEYIRLHPFSQGELRDVQYDFLTHLLAGEIPQINNAAVGRKAHAEVLIKGGYPEAQRRTPARRTRFFESYLEGIVERDLSSIGGVDEPAQVLRLLRAIAANATAELNIERLSSATQTPASTIRRRVELLETLFLTKRLPAFGGNLQARSIKRPKVYVNDTGLLGYLVNANADRIESDLDLGGMFYENFVAMELVRQVSIMDDRPELFHYRDRRGREVDLVVEFLDGSVLGIEVKASATVSDRDFHGLKYLKELVGNRFKGGVLLYAGASTVVLSDNMAAIPLSGLWNG